VSFHSRYSHLSQKLGDKGIKGQDFTFDHYCAFRCWDEQDFKEVKSKALTSFTLDISQNALARALKIPPRRVNEIVNQKRGITADTALRLSKYFGTSAEFWVNLQSKYELESTKDKIAKKIDKEVEVYVV